MLTGINHITLTVSQLERSLVFYTNVLGFKGLVKWDNGAYLSLNDVWLCLTLGVPDIKTDYTHIAFGIVASDFEGFAKKLAYRNIEQWQDNSSEGNSLYFLDPDGHKLEVHVGELVDRLQNLREFPYKGLEWL